jgi:CubicO group peptidase (beta-lactamase class C family)
MLKGLETGLHIGARLYVSLRGQVVSDIVLAEAAPGRLLTHDSLCPWLSSGKPLTAAAIAWLWERKLLKLDDPIQRFIPQFAHANPGKAAITLRHCLTHTAGLRPVISAWTRQSEADILATLCQASLEPNWTPGRSAGYHVASTWYLLGEVVKVVSTKPLDVFLRDFLCKPLGLSSVRLTLTPDEFASIEDTRLVMHDTSKSHSLRAPSASDESPGSTGTSATDTDAAPAPIALPQPMSWETPEIAAVARPGSGIRATAQDIARFYEFLAGIYEPASAVLSHTTRAALTARHRVGMVDQTFRAKVDWGLGVICESSHYNQGLIPYQFGPHASPRTFGHGGNQSSVAFADPEHALVVAAIFNGMPGDPRHDKRLRDTVSAIYTDLGLA